MAGKRVKGSGSDSGRVAAAPISAEELDGREDVHLSMGCGWCITGKHEACIRTITHMDSGKVWTCGCGVCFP